MEGLFGYRRGRSPSIQDKSVPIGVGIIIVVVLGVGIGIGIDPDPDSDADTDGNQKKDRSPTTWHWWAVPTLRRDDAGDNGGQCPHLEFGHFFIKVILDQGHSSRTTRTRTGRVDA
jgi:hypothetical protein